MLAAPAFPVAPGPPSPLDPTLPPALLQPAQNWARGMRRGRHPSWLLSSSSFLSSQRGRRRGPRPEAPFVCDLRRPFAQTLFKAPAPVAVLRPWSSLGPHRPRQRPLQRRAEKHLRPTYLLVIRSVVRLEKQINVITAARCVVVRVHVRCVHSVSGVGDAEVAGGAARGRKGRRRRCTRGSRHLAVGKQRGRAPQ